MCYEMKQESMQRAATLRRGKETVVLMWTLYKQVLELGEEAPVAVTLGTQPVANAIRL
jgi:hypothetical protein